VLLEAHQPEVRSSFPFVFHTEIIHERGGREGFPVRSRRRPVTRPPTSEEDYEEVGAEFDEGEEGNEGDEY